MKFKFFIDCDIIVWVWIETILLESFVSGVML